MALEVFACCDGCSLEVPARKDGEDWTFPKSWILVHGGIFCPMCQREEEFEA